MNMGFTVLGPMAPEVPAFVPGNALGTVVEGSRAQQRMPVHLWRGKERAGLIRQLEFVGQNGGETSSEKGLQRSI